jgi:hypothetical protein
VTRNRFAIGGATWAAGNATAVGLGRPCADCAVSAAGAPIAAASRLRSVARVCGHRAMSMRYVSMSAQMFFAHANAYSPSNVVGPGDNPPEPGTVSNVFLPALYWCTESTCTTSLSVMKL